MTHSHFLIVSIVALSVIIQFAAAMIAIRLIGITGRRAAWSLIATALALMTVRRIVPLYHLLLGDLTYPPDPTNEVIGLVLSIVMAIGISQIAPLFHERTQTEESLRRLNRELRAISTCHQSLMRAKDEQALLNGICHIICDEAVYRMAWVGYVEHDAAKTVRPVAWGGAEDGYLANANITWADTERGRGPTGTAARSGETTGIQDFRIDPQAAPWRENALQRGYRSCIALALKDENTNIFGVLTIYSTAPNAFTPAETRLLEQLAADLAFGITVLRARTERKQAEATRALMAAIVESSNDAIIGKNTDGIITHWNKSAEKIYGYSADEIIGKHITVLAPPPRHAEIHGLLEKIRRGETVVNHESERIRKDGAIIHVALTLSPIKDAAGNITGISTIARDITEKKLVEEKLQEASAYNRSLIEASLDPLVTISPEGKVTDVNRTTEEVTGRKRSELIGTDFSDYFTEPDKAREGYQQVFQNGFVTDYPLAIRHKDGHITDVLYNASIYRNTAGEVLGVFAAARDITERKFAEEKLRRSEHGLAESQRIAHLGNWDLDLVHNVLTWSDEIYRIFEIDPETFGASFEAFLDAIHPDDRELVNNVYTESLKNQMPYDIVHRLLMKDGRVKYVNEKCETYYDENGKPLRSAGTVHDITERKRAEEELRRYKDNLEDEVQQRTADLVLARNAADAANQAKSVFLANMSHELRTPLNAILGFSNMMRRDPLLPDKHRQNIDIINRSGEHLLTLINDVLEMTKIEAGRVQLENAPFDLGSMVRDVTDMMQIRAHEKGLRLLVDQDSRFPRYIVGDEARLRQVMINLMGNAVKFTREGGVTLRLGTSEDISSHLLIEVEDSGPGISPEDQQRIFDPFVQLGEQGDSKGTGLGLSITQQFVQLMGGSISLQSTPGKGSLFRVDLPLNEVIAADIAKPKELEKGEVVGLAPGQPEYRILIVEDQRDNQLLLANLMESVGFQVKLAENGNQGVELFQSWHPHFIWMDRRMPVMDGMEATQRIRQLPGGKEVKIVAVTASAFIEQRAEMLDVGMDDFVRKPYRSNEIYECLSRQLGVRYIYEGMPEPEQPAMALTQEMLSVLPEGLRDELTIALESLETKRIALVIQQVASYDLALQKTLTHLAENFDYSAILKVLRELTRTR